MDFHPTRLQKRLFALQDKKYAAFQLKLIPGMPNDSIIGIRTPQIRLFAKAFAKEPECKAFLQQLPHRYYDENILHAVLLSMLKDYDECIELTEKFVSYINNWAVCDILTPKVFAQNRNQLIAHITTWVQSAHTYTCRFGIKMLMDHYLDHDFDAHYLKLPASVCSNEYYVKMGIAWFYATALAKQWDATLPYIQNKLLPPWTHNKTIQKAIESYRITAEQKAYLRTLKV